MDAIEQSLRAADLIIQVLLSKGHGDYTKHRQAIADLWNGEYGLWEGNNEATTDLNDPELKDLRVIQEDHYDQHMDEEAEDKDGETIFIPHDDKPAWEDMICSVGDYVFFA